MLAFEQELRNLINRHSMENESNTPDFLLVKLLSDTLVTFSAIVKGRENWDGDSFTTTNPEAPPPGGDDE